MDVPVLYFLGFKGNTQVSTFSEAPLVWVRHKVRQEKASSPKITVPNAEDARMKTITVTATQGGVSQEVKLAFSDDEWAAMDNYCQELNRLLQSSFLKTSEHFHLSINFDATTNPHGSITTGAFNEEQWAAFLHLFRPLGALNEKGLLGFQRIRRLIEQRAKESSFLCGQLGLMQQEFRGQHLPLQPSFGIDGKNYDLEAVFDLWLNAKEFHRDANKRETLDKMNQLMADHGIRALLANLVVEKVRAMMRLRDLISTMRGKTKPQRP
jgi:hypothetical protein